MAGPRSRVRLLILSAADLRELVPYAECAGAMRDALTALARGEVHQPLRTVIRPAGAPGLMGLMPAYRQPSRPDAAAAEDGAGYGLKAICITPGNPAAGLDTHQGVVLLSSARTGEPLAVLNASAVTEIRTAAVSLVATELLARPDAAVLAVIGTGVQARAHLLAVAGCRPLREIRVAGRTQDGAVRLAAELGHRVPVPIIPCASAEQAVAGATIVVTATSSAEPVLRRGWLSAGAHVNAVGACLPGDRELDAATVADAALFADSRDSVRTESGDYLLALAEGAIGPDHVRAELGEVLAGTARGRASRDEITVFESLGLAIEDLAAAALAYRTAVARGLGTRVDF